MENVNEREIKLIERAFLQCDCGNDEWDVFCELEDIYGAEKLVEVIAKFDPALSGEMASLVAAGV